MTTTEVRINGKTHYLPSAEIRGRTVIVTGKYLRRAAMWDEDWLEGESVEDPIAFLDEMRGSPLRADILTFSQKIPKTTPKYDYRFEWDNWAALRITNFDDWWGRRVPQETRKNVHRAGSRGVTVKAVQFGDAFVRGIQRIYNETPIRQGRRFWHFGKDFDQIKKENSTYLDRSDFLGAYLKDELIGFMKIVYVDRIGALMQIIAKDEHRDKRL